MIYAAEQNPNNKKPRIKHWIPKPPGYGWQRDRKAYRKARQFVLRCKIERAA